MVEFKAANEVQLYPNPSATYCSISGLSGIVKVMIYDLSGQLIWSITNYQSLTPIDISNWRDGVYHVQVIEANGNLHSLRLLKSNK